MTSANLTDVAPTLFGDGEVNNFIFNNAPAAICYTRNRIIVGCNRRFEELFGYGGNELNQQSVRVLYPDDEAFNKIWDTDRYYFKENKNKSYISERPMVAKTGEFIWCIISGKTIDPENPGMGSIWVFQDISDHKHLEDQLIQNIETLEAMVSDRTSELTNRLRELNLEVVTRKKAEATALESKRKYSTLFDLLPIGISITDQNGRILEANRVFRELVERTTGSLTNWRTVKADFYFENGAPLPKTKLFSTLYDHLKRNISNLELGFRLARTGKRRWLSVSSSELFLQDKAVLVTAFLDITYRKRIEELERLRHAELSRIARINSTSEMGAALAHQMGQPLVSALNYLLGCRLRLESVPGISEIKDTVNLAINNLEQAGQVLSRVRDFVSKHNPDKQPEDLNELVREAIDFLKFDICRKRITIVQQLEPSLPLVPLCRIEILQVLFNLIKNGMEAMEEVVEDEKMVIIATGLCVAKKVVYVTIQDHGDGIRKGVARKVFEPFFSTKSNGMGVGLTICRAIIESHDGELTYSRAGQRGSVFQFTLPAAVDVCHS